MGRDQGRQTMYNSMARGCGRIRKEDHGNEGPSCGHFAPLLGTFSVEKDRLKTIGTFKAGHDTIFSRCQSLSLPYVGGR